MINFLQLGTYTITFNIFSLKIFDTNILTPLYELINKHMEFRPELAFRIEKG
jgi:hypothetical protein